MTATAIALALYIFGAASVWAAAAGFIVQAGYLVVRGVELGRLPLVGVHDTLSFLAASTLAFAFATLYGMKDRARLGVMIKAASVLAAAFTVGALLQKPHTMPLPPVLKTYWFELHVAMSFLSYALFAVAAILGAMYLRRKEDDLEAAAYKAVFTGYSLFCISMILGGVWAFYAWGTYWLWTPKELWTSMLWFYYGFYLHARLVGKWQGRTSAWMAIVGFGVVMFTYLGVGLLMKSSHSF